MCIYMYIQLGRVGQTFSPGAIVHQANQHAFHCPYSAHVSLLRMDPQPPLLSDLTSV